ncbi:GNAT family N-acetyltransferase [Bacillus pseudomycoides]|uniref:GNAT family N-acetyltransferase n=1 Tax=Bacillus pseudomycoides TaxID=64104 RepID=UPI000BEBD0D1|nr:GNAT family N-acetyltransferase [Bacillus pseudomycoides]PEE40886.1 GNAT family N-acetyltransferase [Bacillus pseudomycoides]PGA93862.1 GNAT family N-acetyltransferase [Bacillus pseudomycoides]PHF27998.1 GNAT family N-acetyltransferase [Bacillus pseudomycoides]
MSTVQKNILASYNGMHIRVFDSKKDDIEQLTRVLNKSYKKLADLGFNYLASHQDSSITLERIKKALCLVAIQDNKIIGSISYYSPENNKGCNWYNKGNVATIGQFGIHPSYQSMGIGRKLIELVEEFAIKEGIEELALDTAEGASHLIKYYSDKGYRFIEYINWEITNYRSVILSKKLK